MKWEVMRLGGRKMDLIPGSCLVRALLYVDTVHVEVNLVFSAVVRIGVRVA